MEEKSRVWKHSLSCLFSKNCWDASAAGELRCLCSSVQGCTLGVVQLHLAGTGTCRVSWPQHPAVPTPLRLCSRAVGLSQFRYLSGAAHRCTNTPLLWDTLFTSFHLLLLWLCLFLYLFNDWDFVYAFLVWLLKWCDYVCFPFKGCWCPDYSILEQLLHGKIYQKTIWRMWSCGYKHTSEWVKGSFGSWNGFFFYYINDTGDVQC